MAANADEVKKSVDMRPCVYEVTCTVDAEHAAEFKPWLTGHLDEMLACKTESGSDIFTSAQMLEVVKPQVIFVLGGPGAGKGTQCGNIVSEYSFFKHISAGDCLRAERKNPESKDGELINEYIKEGKIVPVEITANLLKKAIMTGWESEGKTHFLIDGFPRNQENLEGWQRICGPETEVMYVLFFELAEDVMEARLLERGKTSGRVDDNKESIKKRFKTYEDQTLPIVNHFDGLGMVERIDAARSKDEVFGSVKELLAKIGEYPRQRSLIASYECANKAALEEYYKTHAPKLRGSSEGKAFRKSLKLARRVLPIVKKLP